MRLLLGSVSLGSHYYGKLIKLATQLFYNDKLIVTGLVPTAAYNS